MKVKTKPKKTPIGEIPEDWEVVRLKDIADKMYYGITAKAIENMASLRMLRTTDIKNYKISWKTLPYCEITEKRKDIKKYFVQKDDLIIARAGTVGVSVLVEENVSNVIFGSYLIKVVLKKDKVYPRFIHYYFQSDYYWRHIQNASSGSTLKNINLPILKSLKISLPPLPEQKKIAEILRTVDEAIEKTDLAIEKTERLKKGLMQRLLTRGIKHERFKKTEIGEIPEEWKVIKIKEIAKVKYGKSIPKEKGGIPAVGSSGIYAYVNEALITFPTLVIGRKGTAGSVYLIKQPCWPSDTTFYLEFKNTPKVRLEYLSYYLNFKKLSGEHAKTTLPSLKRERLENYTFSLPPLEEQKQIAEILMTVDKKLELLRKRKEKLERIKKGLMKDLLTGKRRVKA